MRSREEHQAAEDRGRSEGRARSLGGLLAAAVLILPACSAGSHGAGLRPPPTGVAAPSPPTVPTPPPGPVTTPVPTTRVGCTDESVIRSWPVARRAAQLVVVPVADASPDAVRVAVASGAGGILLLGSVPSGRQLVAALQPALSGGDLPRPFVMVDQEGGGVQRLGADVTPMPWPRQMTATMTPAQVKALAQGVARQMAALGVGVDLAPVLDVDSGPALSVKDPDGPRSFSADPAVAAEYGLAFSAGLQSGGVLAVAKHFPGLGASTGNTDYGPASTRPLADLEASGLIPFERATAAGAAGAPAAVMVANASVPGLTTRPASVSASVVGGLLRDRLHFSGLVMTDSLSAGAITAAGYDVTSAAVASIEAGTDMILFGSTLTPADRANLQPGPLRAQTASIVAAVEKAVTAGSLPESRLDDAVGHVVRAKGGGLCAGVPG